MNEPESRMDRLERALEIQQVNLESLHSNVRELQETPNGTTRKSLN